jgi:hypothetical protein
MAIMVPTGTCVKGNWDQLPIRVAKQQRLSVAGGLGPLVYPDVTVATGAR